MTGGGTLSDRAASASPLVLHVNAAARGANDGTSWGNAFTNLQDAWSAAGDEIWVAAGTYRPAPPEGDRRATFQLASGRALYGGFAGTETNRDERHPGLHRTILSGDLNGDDIPGTWENMTDNSLHVVTASNVTATAILDGFLITRGHSDTDGAGLWLRRASPTLTRCTIQSNLAVFGAGLSLVDSAPVITHCTFSDNLAWSGRGGAIHADATQTSSIVIRGCQFLRNEAWVNAGPGDAGAVWGFWNCILDVSDCLFERNEARWRFAAGNQAANGGAMVLFGDGSRLDRCIFRQNRAHIGGALWLAANGTIANCLFIGNEAYRVSSGAFDYGGYAGAAYIAPNRTNLIVNCTFHANKARSTGGIWTAAGNATTLANCILWSNTSTEIQAKPLDDQLSGSTRPRYCCMRDLFTPEPGEDPPDPGNYPGCITNAPLCVDELGSDGLAGTADDDLRLQSGSPCVDAGNNALLPVWATFDLAGNPRRFDAPAADAGGGDAPLADMGAYEFFTPLRARLEPAGTGPWQLNWNDLGTGWSYTVERRDTLEQGAWVPVATNLLSPGFTVTPNAVPGAAFYRVRSELLP